MQEIQVSIKSKYGTELIYPVCQKAKLLCQLMQQTTFTARDIAILKELEYKLVDSTPRKEF